MRSRRVTWPLVLVVVVAAVVAAVWRSGVVAPRFALGEQSAGSHGWDPPRQTITIRNDGWTEMTLLAVGRDGPGLRLVGTDVVLPYRLGAGRSVSIELRYVVTDCGEVPVGAWPVPVTADAATGPYLRYFWLPPEEVGPGWPVGGPGLVAWQRAISWGSCHSVYDVRPG
ncbi:hypothetical protein QEZ54_21975 [Catellatospora sp. KI3]|uniref:hypothetical protein n=1 Tax=Catellatospora sp. KI3 TaxID=3041620 RepID=UPI002482F15D|nr:hypothetical protein [Catellatospora sp. KI3]MDI1463654.1 hypothetical protein [Catellatospora sp. KI3]